MACWLLVVACRAQRAALPRLVLHVGSHKTGTTFAQRFLVNGVDDLGVACVACAHEKEAAVLPAVLLNATSGPSVRYDDRRAFDAVVAETLAALPDEVAKYRAGTSKLRKLFLGKAMAASRGRAGPAGLNAALDRALPR